MPTVTLLPQLPLLPITTTPAQVPPGCPRVSLQCPSDWREPMEVPSVAHQNQQKLGIPDKCLCGLLRTGVSWLVADGLAFIGSYKSSTHIPIIARVFSHCFSSSFSLCIFFLYTMECEEDVLIFAKVVDYIKVAFEKYNSYIFIESAIHIIISALWFGRSWDPLWGPSVAHRAVFPLRKEERWKDLFLVEVCWHPGILFRVPPRRPSIHPSGNGLHEQV